MRCSLGDLIGFFREDGMDGVFIEGQNVEAFGLSDRDSSTAIGLT